MAFRVVVLAGGSGTRLWPLSRAAVPKHLLPLAAGGRTLLAATLDRVRPLTELVWVVTVAAQAERCAAELAAAGLDPARVIAEPGARGTGPALGLAMHTLAAGDPDAIVASVHADAHILDDDGYRRCVVAAAGWARVAGGLATVGVDPVRPATGLGYIELGDALAPADWRVPAADLPLAAEMLGPPPVLPAAHRAVRFVEKPDLATATAYVAGGRHVWNTGLFAWEVATFLAELAAASAEIDAGVATAAAARRRGAEEEARAAYLALPSVAVDPLVLERTQRLVAVRGVFGWSDVGSWADLADARRDGGEADGRGNVTLGDTVLSDGVRACYVDSGGGRLVAVVGAQGITVVDTGDVVLVVGEGGSQGVKGVVDELRRRGRTDLV
ncbi:MAG TPA: sugar phosphate nucleotidyltransferase [Candidatus Dormibacteraeota bacterium]|nr:sugar phosphate nucleotidyltransferase [Candidatus Dormibacteraeota bacterium]